MKSWETSCLVSENVTQYKMACIWILEKKIVYDLRIWLQKKSIYFFVFMQQLLYVRLLNVQKRITFSLVQCVM